jgi:hypothetical protein
LPIIKRQPAAKPTGELNCTLSNKRPAKEALLAVPKFAYRATKKLALLRHHQLTLIPAA